jgi:hypothetical protein
MSDFNTVLIEDSRLQITDEITYGVVSGAAQSSYQSFVAQTASSSNVIWNVIVPSEQVAIDKNALMKTTISFTMTIGQGEVTEDNINTSLFSYGVSDALQSFPMNRLINTANCQINNSSTSVNLKDVLPSLLCLYDKRELNKYKSTCPCLPDSFYANYGTYTKTTGGNPFIPGVNYYAAANTNNPVFLPAATTNVTNRISALNSPLNGYSSQGLDTDFVPRGAFSLDRLEVMQLDATGDFVSFNGVVKSPGNYVVVSATFTTTEPLFISPFTLTPKGNNQQAMIGINNMNVQLNIDSTASRLLSTSLGYYVNGANDAFTRNITLGCSYHAPPSGQSSPPTISETRLPFENCTLLLNMLTLQPSQYGQIKSRNVLPYFDIPRYLSNVNQNSTVVGYQPPDNLPVIGGTSSTANNVISIASVPITSTSLQLNVVPDLLLISVRKPMALQNSYDADAFLILDKISISFNNVQGLLANCTPEQLWRMSVMNGSNQSWEQFRGFAMSPQLAVYSDSPDAIEPTGTAYQQPTSGSLLVVSAKDLNLPDFLSAGSLGQFQLFFTATIKNQLPDGFSPEISVICLNSGIFTTMQGASQFNVGLLTKQKVLDTKKQDAVSAIDSHEYERLVGGRMNDSALSGLAQLVRKYRHRKQGAGVSGGASSGGAFSGGGRLSRHLM